MSPPIRSPRKPPPGSRWRVLAHERTGFKSHQFQDRGVFDELVVDDWFHLEQVGARAWWMRVGETYFAIEIGRNGKVKLSVTEGAEKLGGAK